MGWLVITSHRGDHNERRGKYDLAILPVRNTVNASNIVLNIIVSFTGALIRQRPERLWSYRPVADADVVDQAGPEGSEYHGHLMREETTGIDLTIGIPENDGVLKKHLRH
jgi:hypothetical protein